MGFRLVVIDRESLSIVRLTGLPRVIGTVGSMRRVVDAARWGRRGD